MNNAKGEIMRIELPLISVLMPAYNAEPYIQEAIDSVLDQTWTNWELVIINDGSSDGTSTILSKIKDDRIMVIDQSNQGVSAARNRALENSRGTFFCFLDADDRIPPNSLNARADILMNDPSINFSDGVVCAFEQDKDQLTPIHQPTVRGLVFSKLMEISSACFFGPSWMIRRTPTIERYRFPVHMKHAEDLAYFMSIAREGNYDHTKEVILHYRKGHHSAMSDLHGLDRGYIDLYQHATSLTPPPSSSELEKLWQRIRRIMFRSFLKNGHFRSALRTIFRRRPTVPDEEA